MWFLSATPYQKESPPVYTCRVQEKGWVTAELMIKWIKTVWGWRPGALFPSLLIVHRFHGRLLESVCTKLRELRTDLAVMPGGLT